MYFFLGPIEKHHNSYSKYFTYTFYCYANVFLFSDNGASTANPLKKNILRLRDVFITQMTILFLILALSKSARSACRTLKGNKIVSHTRERVILILQMKV